MISFDLTGKCCDELVACCAALARDGEEGLGSDFRCTHQHALDAIVPLSLTLAVVFVILICLHFCKCCQGCVKLRMHTPCFVFC